MDRTERRGRGSEPESGRAERALAWRSCLRGLVDRAAVLVAGAVLVGGAACGGSTSDVADTGGMSGTGVSQGRIDAFGSIFVNGVEWDLSSTSIEVDGSSAGEDALRLGMVVRIRGDRAPDGSSGTARSVVFDDAIEGPIEDDPVETVPGVERSFDVLGTTVFVRVDDTVFGPMTSFAALAAEDRVEVSGFVDANGAIRATRIVRTGTFPDDDEVERRGRVTTLQRDPLDPDSGDFLLGPILVRFTADTDLSDFDGKPLENGDLVEVEGRLRVNELAIDADEIELEREGLGDGDAEDAEIEGVVAPCAPAPDFCVAGTPVDASQATFEPPGFVPTAGDRVEVEGRLEAGVLVAERVESEEDDDDAEDDVQIEAAVTSVDAAARSLVILGVTVEADGDTELEDQAGGDENFRFSDIAPGDWLEIEGARSGDGTVRAESIEREDASAGTSDVVLEGPVSSLDVGLPAIAILGRDVPVDVDTAYLDADGESSTEAAFFADLSVGDVVRVVDRGALDLGVLGEADEVAPRQDD